MGWRAGTHVDRAARVAETLGDGLEHVSHVPRLVEEDLDGLSVLLAVHGDTGIHGCHLQEVHGRRKAPQRVRTQRVHPQEADGVAIDGFTQSRKRARARTEDLVKPRKRGLVQNGRSETEILERKRRGRAVGALIFHDTTTEP